MPDSTTANSSASPPPGGCTCPPWDINDLPGEDQSLRRLLLALGQKLAAYQTTSDATKKFSDDLKDGDKEYQGLSAVVAKYTDFYNGLHSKISQAQQWMSDVQSWSKDKLDDGTRAAIKKLWQDSYQGKEKQLTCKWIADRDALIGIGDCRSRAARGEEEATDDYNAIKGLDKSIGDRLTDLKSLYDKAKSVRDASQFKSVYAVELEFAHVWTMLGTLSTWDARRTKCKGSAQPNPSNPEQDWPPDKYKVELSKALRKLILAKYQRFKWDENWVEADRTSRESKAALDLFQNVRRNEFFQEAEDVQPTAG